MSSSSSSSSLCFTRYLILSYFYQFRSNKKATGELTNYVDRRGCSSYRYLYVTPSDFIRGYSARDPDPLPFHIVNFGKSAPFHIVNFGKSGPFHIVNFGKSGPFHIFFPEKVPLSHTFPWKGTPFTYLQPGKGTHTWNPRRSPFRAEHPPWRMFWFVRYFRTLSPCSDCFLVIAWVIHWW